MASSLPTLCPPPALMSPIQTDEDRVFESAAELFALLATPIRLKIIRSLCNGDKNVSQLLDEIATTQPNMSQHLATLHRAGLVTRQRVGTQVYYGLQSQRVATLCRAVCSQVALELEPGSRLPPEDRLAPTLAPR